MTHTSTEQPEALRLADYLEMIAPNECKSLIVNRAAQELRRLHARVQELEAAQAQRAPLSDAEALKLLKSGPVYAPNGEVNRRPLEYRREIENARLRGFRVAERTYGITQEKQG